MMLVGDSEFGAVDVLQQLGRWRWDYGLPRKVVRIFVFLDKRYGATLGGR